MVNYKMCVIYVSAIVGISGCNTSQQYTKVAQQENDDLYVSSSDRNKNDKTYPSSSVVSNDDQLTAKNVNPEYISQYARQSKNSVKEEQKNNQQKTYSNDTYSSRNYFDQGYTNNYSTSRQQNRWNQGCSTCGWNNSYWGPSWGQPQFGWGGMMGYSWGWPNSYWGSSWSSWYPGFNIGWNTRSGWNVGYSWGWSNPAYGWNSWYSPYSYYSYGYYGSSAWSNPYWNGYNQGSSSGESKTVLYGPRDARGSTYYNPNAVSDPGVAPRGGIVNNGNETGQKMIYPSNSSNNSSTPERYRRESVRDNTTYSGTDNNVNSGYTNSTYYNGSTGNSTTTTYTNNEDNYVRPRMNSNDYYNTNTNTNSGFRSNSWGSNSSGNSGTSNSNSNSGGSSSGGSEYKRPSMR